MNLYEHTIIARQDTSPSELKSLTDKYSKIIEKKWRNNKNGELGLTKPILFNQKKQKRELYSL